MISRTYSQKQVSIITQSMRAFSSNQPTTICIMATQLSYDSLGAKIMRQIKNQSDEQIQFIGIGGEQMRSEGLVREYQDVEAFEDKPFYPWKNYLAKHINQPLHAALGHYIMKDYKIVKNLFKEKKFASDAIDGQNPQAFFILGNNHFMYRFTENVHDYYELTDKFCPPIYYYDKLISNSQIDQEDYCDHQFYRIPKQPVNWSYYEFPSTFVGFSGITKALSHLYKRSSNYSGLVEENSVFVSREQFSDVVETLLPEERNRFRQEHGIDDSQTVFYVSPGNVKDEINYAIPAAKGMIDAFIKHFEKFSASNFHVVIPVDSSCSSQIKDQVSSSQFPVKVTFVEGDERFSAIAASDMGAIISGEAVAEAAALQLPTVILTNMNWYKSYRTLLYNSFADDLNITVEGEAFPEYLGQQFPEKLAESWIEWFEDPKKGFDRIHRFDKVLANLIPVANGQVSDGLNADKRKVGDFTFERHYHSDYLVARKVLDGVNKYKQANNSNLKYFEVNNARMELAKNL